jgi:hypothetical protein
MAKKYVVSLPDDERAQLLTHGSLIFLTVFNI